MRQVVDATVHVGIDVEVFVAHGIEHAQRLLGRGGIVKVDERPTVNLSAEDGEVFPSFLNVEHGKWKGKGEKREKGKNEK